MRLVDLLSEDVDGSTWGGSSWPVVTVALVACACGSPPNLEPDECGLVPGDLVITEIMADPDGADAGREWFEIHNVLSESVPLRGLVLEKSRGDGTGRKLWPIDSSAAIPPDAFFVVADVPDDTHGLEYVDYGYGDALTALPNGEGYLAVTCGATVLDAVAYGKVPAGAAWSLDAGALDADSNDAMSNWCAVESRGTMVAGTPGARNPPCGDATWRLPCLENGQQRASVLPAPGDVILSEILANPAAVSDAQGEFLEIYVANAVDLNGLQLKRELAAERPDFVLDDSKCLRVDAGTYVVLGAALEDNGGVPVDFALDMTLPNGEGTIHLCAGDEVLDQLAYGAAVEGVSYGRDIRGDDATSDQASWCLAVSEYGAGDLGTPGSANDSCEAAGSVGRCTEAGTSRPALVPLTGDLVITELMQDPRSVSDAVGEWFEICATRGVDLNGLEIGKDGSVVDVIVATECLFVEPGECVVFGKSLDPSVNGGVPADLPFTAALVNGSGTLFLAHEGNVLDVVTWSASTAGVSTSFSGDPLSPAANDRPDSWCDGAAPWPEGAGDWGSPGVSNPVCAVTPADGTCLDGGSLRSMVVPGPGDVVITEVMPNPLGSDTIEEWVELFAFTEFDLGALSFGVDAAITDAPVHPSSPGDCLPVTGGDYVVVARSPEAEVAPDAVWSRMLLNNAAEDALWVGAGGISLDHVGWSEAGEGESLCRLQPTLPAWGVDDGGTPGGENATCVGP